jgi:hypothetical protein
MSQFAMETLGAYPVYPGHTNSISLCVLRKYPKINDAFERTSHGWPTALGDGDISGAGGCVHQGLDLIRRIMDHGDTPEEAVAWGVEQWRDRTLVGGDHRARYEEGVAEAERIAPMLLEELRRLKASV